MLQRMQNQLERFEQQGLKRQLRLGSSAPMCDQNGQTCINLSSNNYLGLSHHPQVLAAASEALQHYGLGAGASPLISGHHPAVAQLEAALAAYKQQQAALVFSSGYAANVGLLCAVAGPKDTLIFDALNHASILDGGRQSGAKVIKYAHNNMQQLEACLQQPRRGQAFVVVDGVFSMDGDTAVLPAVAELTERYGAYLIVDDAHGSGVLGGGLGTAWHYGVQHKVFAHMGTLSKAYGAQGGFVAGSEVLVRYLLHKARSLMFSTGIAPAVAAGAQAALEVAQQQPALRHTLLSHVGYLRQQLQALGYQVLGEDITPMVMVNFGQASQALQVQQALLQHGVWAPAIRPPTVPEGSSRLRLTPMASHSSQHMHAVVEAFRGLLSTL